MGTFGQSLSDIRTWDDDDYIAFSYLASQLNEKERAEMERAKARVK